MTNTVALTDVPSALGADEHDIAVCFHSVQWPHYFWDERVVSSIDAQQRNLRTEARQMNIISNQLRLSHFDVIR